MSTAPARLPSLPHVQTDNVQLQRWIQAVQERLEVREGSRGNQDERVVLQRDLKALGLDASQFGVAGSARSGSVSGSSVLVQDQSGNFTRVPLDAFSDELRKTRLYRDLMLRIDDPSRFDDVPAQVRAILLTSIAEEAAQRGADVRRVESKLQSATESIAGTLQEVTAALGSASAGVREVQFAASTANASTAGKVTQIQARIDDFVDGTPGVATLEEKMTASASRVDGLRAQYTLKVGTGNKIAGIGLASTTSTAGVGTSAIILQADKFALVGSSETVSDPANPPVNRLPFGYDSGTNTIYINGQVRINAGGVAIEDSVKLLTLNPTGYAFVYENVLATTSPSPTITFTAALQNLTGTATYTATAYNAAGTSLGTITLGGSGNTRTMTSAQFNSLGATTTRYVVVTATLSGLTDTTTIYRGDSGSDAIAILMDNEACTVPANSAGTVTSFAGASSIVKVFQGITDVTSSWTFTAATSNVGGTFNGSALPVGSGFTGVAAPSLVATSLSADVGYVTVTATRTGHPTQTKVFSISKSTAGATGATGSTGSTGAAGSRGSVTRYGSGAWADATANALLPSAAVIGDTVTLSTGSAAVTKYWGGSAWLDPGVVIDGNLLVSGTVSASKISAGSLSAAVNISTSGFLWVDGTASYGGLFAAGAFNTTQTATHGILSYTNKGAAVWGVSSAGFYGVKGSGSTAASWGVHAENYYSYGNALKVSGYTEMTGTMSITGVITSTVATGTAPFAVSSSTVCTNLNANWLQGYNAASFALAGHNHSGVYADAGHNHSGVYVPVAHTSSGDHDARYPYNWPTDSGVAYASSGMNLLTSGIGGVQTRGTGNVIYIEAISDARLKQDITPETLGLDFVNALRPVSYRLIANPKTKYHGFIAQDLGVLIAGRDDALYQTHDNGMHGVDYQAIIGPLVKAVQELTARITALENP